MKINEKEVYPRPNIASCQRQQGLTQTMTRLGGGGRTQMAMRARARTSAIRIPFISNSRPQLHSPISIMAANGGV